MYYDQKESGQRIKYLRKKKGMTQEQLASKLNIGISTLGKIEIGYSGLSIDLLLDIAEFFDVSTDYVLTGAEFNFAKTQKQIIAAIKLLEEAVSDSDQLHEH